MRRRSLLVLLGAFLAGMPVAANAQKPPAKLWRIGFLGVSYASGYVLEMEWIREGLRAAGYVEGVNLVIESRWAEGKPELLKAIAEEFVARKVDLIVTYSLPGGLAAARASSTIPIVLADSGDPVAAGLAANLAHPGGNVTGSTGFVAEETVKRLEMLREAVPRLRRVAFLYSTVPPAATVAETRRALEDAAAAVRIEVQDFVVREAFELAGAFNAMAKARIEGVVVNIEPLLNSQPQAIAALALVKHLPSVGFVSYGEAGGLIGYSANRRALYRRVGYFADRIFKGAKPGEIPFERAARFDLVINQKIARELGITIPQSLLVRADRVIE